MSMIESKKKWMSMTVLAFMVQEWVKNLSQQDVCGVLCRDQYKYLPGASELRKKKSFRASTFSFTLA